jgi:hypothetical protein
MVKRTPSNRISPSSDASQTKPSVVWATEWMLFCGRPSVSVQREIRYCVMRRGASADCAGDAGCAGSTAAARTAARHARMPVQP